MMVLQIRRKNMQKILTKLTLSIAVAFTAIEAKPMESLDNYNVIIVHGAADSESGIDCKNNSEIFKEASEYGRKDKEEGVLNKIPGEDKGLLRRMGSNDAVGMIKELYPWLSHTLFDRDTLAIYLQRPFTNPANSPDSNAREIGDGKWQRKDKCSERRSLIEEAQEVRAEGRDSLKKYRSDVKYRDKLPPSRNILIAHSLGGVSSREYVV
jgi:hypothetical protein